MPLKVLNKMTSKLKDNINIKNIKNIQFNIFQ